MAKEVVSEKFSFKGWNFKTWVSKNKDNLRLVVSGVFGIASVAVANLNPAWSAALGLTVTGLSKMILDGIDYYVSE